MRLVLSALVLFAAFNGVTQTRQPSKAKPAAQAESAAVNGFVVAPVVLKDEGCTRDYVRAFQFEGVELRKRLADLGAYGCSDLSAKGIFTAVASQRKDFALDRDYTAYFRFVVMTYDRKRTEIAAENNLVSAPGHTVYMGWVADEYFHGVTPELGIAAKLNTRSEGKPNGIPG